MLRRVVAQPPVQLDIRGLGGILDVAEDARTTDPVRTLARGPRQRMRSFDMAQVTTFERRQRPLGDITEDLDQQLASSKAWSRLQLTREPARRRGPGF
jgi:hypothetical protein